MKYLMISLVFFTFSCSDESSSFIQKDHEIIKTEIVANYEKNRHAFQSLAKEVATFRIVRAIQFKYGNESNSINVYCDSIDRNGEGYSFVIQDLNDARLQKVLHQEGITQATLETIKQKLDDINCNSFFTLRQPDISSGTPYVHIEFEYNSWNGANFYYYKLFDKKMEPDMANFFNQTKVVMEQIKSTGGVLDSNAVWYLVAD